MSNEEWSSFNAKDSTFLVTGGAGFIGSHIVEQLVQQGKQVRVLDNFSTGHRENLATLAGKFDLVEGDLADRAVLRRALEGVDCVLHQAALPSVTLSIADPYTVNHVNLVGTLRLLVAAREAGVKRVVFASTCAVYGDESSMPHQENTPSRPKSPYAVSKLAAEYYCQVFNSAYGLETVALRYFNVFGPRQDPDQEYAGVISKFMAVMLRGESPVIYGDGLQSRDFIYIDNVVAANFLALASPNMIGRAFNVATGARYSLLDLVATLNEILGTHIEPIFAATRSGDIKHSQADIRLIQQYGYQVRVDFRAGLEKTIAWHKARIAQDQLMHRSRSSVTTV